MARAARVHMTRLRRREHVMSWYSCRIRTVSSPGQLVHPAAPHCCSEVFDAATLDGHVELSMLSADGH